MHKSREAIDAMQKAEFEAQMERANTPKILWWGYVHVNGSIQVKRFFDNRDIEEANESPFVQFTFGPYEAANREEALANCQVNLKK